MRLGTQTEAGFHSFFYACDGISYYKRLKEVENVDVMTQTVPTYSGKQSGEKNILKKDIKDNVYKTVLVRTFSHLM